MHLVLASDSFKGSLSASLACEAMARGAERAFAALRDDASTLQGSTLQITSVPLADGGEGTVEALLLGAGGKRRTARVLNPSLEPVLANWGMLDDGRVVLEMAQASGLTLVAPAKRDALRASSFGTGQLLKAALDAGCCDILIGIGGSATTDGGSGALSALGARFLDARGELIAPGGIGLRDLRAIDLSSLDARLKSTRLTVLCDVTNPLYGENGAALVYAPQKGASPAEVRVLDENLRYLSAIAEKNIGHDFSSVPGAGAAGGVGFGLLAFCNAQLKPGIEVVLEATHFAEKLQSADLVLTGEGALDAQTLSGKAIAGMCRVAREHNVPVLAFGGQVALSGEELSTLGLLSAFPIADAPLTPEASFSRAAQLLENAVERALRVWLAR